MSPIAFSFKKFFGVNLRSTRPYVARAAKRSFIDCGWNILPLNGALSYRADFIAVKGSTEVAVRCSGEDSRLFGSQVVDIREECLKRSLHPVFITAERVDPNVREQVYAGCSEVILDVNELDQIEFKIAQLRPMVVGAVDWIGLPNILQGWAKLSPVAEPATVVAQLGSEVLGSCEASGLPSSSEGHSKYGFRLVLARGLEKRQIFGELRIKVLHQGRYVRLLEIWSNAPVVDLGTS